MPSATAIAKRNSKQLRHAARRTPENGGYASSRRAAGQSGWLLTKSHWLCLWPVASGYGRHMTYHKHEAAKQGDQRAGDKNKNAVL
jgi:hypothetical protein